MINDLVTYLRRDNPRLLQLEADYSALSLPFGHTQWKDHQNVGVDIANFRADGAYLGQGGLDKEPQYRAMYEYVKSIDFHDYLAWLKEDGEFGITTYEYDDRLVSRDLCDSIMEIYFVEAALGHLYHSWLDIGAGYGRFAHRLIDLYAMYNIAMMDAVPVSTFLCQFYAEYRGFGFPKRNNPVLPLPYVLDNDFKGRFDIACNIHSWSECSSAAIDFWLDKLVLWRVPYLFVVPHDERWVCVNEDGSIGNFKGNILSRGWEEIASRPKYSAGVDGLFPEVHYHMFRREV